MNEIQHLVKPKDGPAPRWFHVAVAASMIISAVSALIATLHTGRTMTALVEQNAKLVRANSTPILEFGHGNVRDDGDKSLEFFVRNVGTGIARVVWFEFRVDGKPMENMAATLQSLGAGPVGELSFMSGPISGRVFAAGAEQRFFGWPRPGNDKAALLAVWTALDKARFARIQVEACYCSVFDECWTSSMNGDVPKASATCSGEKRVALRG